MTTIDLTTIRTPKTGKTLKDFQVPEKLMSGDPDLVAMILQTESMDDAERQYWFNLVDVMRPEQIQKLRGILSREREKMTEIAKKYGPKRPELTPDEVAQRNAKLQQQRAQEQAALRARERAAEAAEDDEAILAELDTI